MSENRFYYQGKFFETQEEFYKYAIEWSKLPLDKENSERMLEELKSNILFNLPTHAPEMTNQEFKKLLEEMFIFAIKKMWKIYKSKNAQKDQE